MQSKTQPAMLWILIGKEEFKFIKLQESFIPMQVTESRQQIVNLSPRGSKFKAILKIASNMISKSTRDEAVEAMCAGLSQPVTTHLVKERQPGKPRAGAD